MPQFSIRIKPHHRQKAWEKQAAYFFLNAVKMARSGSAVYYKAMILSAKPKSQKVYYSQ